MRTVFGEAWLKSIAAGHVDLGPAASRFAAILESHPKHGIMPGE
jgi:hypothetical protein